MPQEAKTTELLVAALGGHSAVDDTTTALMAAALGGHTAVVEILLDVGADTDRGNEGGATALTLATDEGHAEVIAVLMKAAGTGGGSDEATGASPNHTSCQHKIEELTKEVHELKQALHESEQEALQRDYEEFKQPDANGDDVISRNEVRACSVASVALERQGERGGGGPRVRVRGRGSRRLS